MSVDYDANFGIGYKVYSEEDFEDGLAEYLDENLADGFEYFEVGSGSYTGETDDVFVVIKDPLGDGFLELAAKKQALDAELERLNLMQDSGFDVVGGLRVW